MTGGTSGIILKIREAIEQIVEGIRDFISDIITGPRRPVKVPVQRDPNPGRRRKS